MTFFFCIFKGKALPITSVTLPSSIHASSSYQWPFAPLTGNPRCQSHPPRRSGHAHHRCPFRTVGDDVIGSVSQRDESRNLAASLSCTVMLRTWTPSPSSSSSHIPGFTCEVRADLHVLEVFVQKCCFQRRLWYAHLVLYCHHDINTSPVFVFFCAYVFSLDIVVTEHLRGILRQRHAETDTNTVPACRLEIICLYVHTL